MTKDVRRALLVARRMFAGGGDTTTTTVSPGVSVSSKGSNKSGESTVAKPADKLPLQEPLPATTVNYQNLLPSNMGLLTPASAPGGGLPNVPGFTAGPSGFGSLVPASASLTQPFGAMPMGSPNLGAPTPSIGASTAPMAGFSNPSLAQATFNYAPEKYVPKPLEPTPSPFTTAATAPGTTTAEKDENADFVDGWSGAQGSSGGDVGESSARGGAINEHPHTHAMDPRDLPGIHVRTAHTFAAGGAATQGQGQDQDEGEGFDAYHGSPHAFERFDPSNIGTGEGSQAFGHGLYFAEKKRTAQDYQDRLRPNDWFAQRSRKLMEQYGDWGQAVDKIISMYHESPKKKEIFRQSLLKEGPPTGHLYHVRIKANPEHFLDWDAPIQEQPDVWWKLSKLVSDKAHGPEEVGPDKKRIPWSTLLQDMEENDKMTGSDIHRLLTHPEAIGFHPEQAAQALHAAGIPGIKYWDAGSRREGQGTRNYVIFNPDIIHVKRRYADGGLIQDKYPSHYMPGVGRQVMRTGGEPSNPLEEYRDPESKRMAGWDWAPLSQVHESLGSFKEIPSHVEAFGDFMNETAKKAATTGLTPRDLIKAYVITRSSIQREGRRPEKVLEHWPDFPGPTDKIIRPEGAMGEWLQTPMGQRYLDSAVKGNVDHDAVQDAMRAMRSFGMTEKGEAQALPYAAKMLPGQEGRVSDMVARAIHSDSAPQEWRDWATKLHGIKYAKSGFLASMLGRGDQPTADARQYNVHSGMAPGKERNKLIDKAQVDSVLRLAARQRALNIGMPSALTPYYQHLVHHTVWDKAGNDVTTHEDLINAMRHAADGGEINETPIHQHVLAHAMRAAGLPGLGRQVMADGGDPGSDPMVQKAMLVVDKYKKGGSVSSEQAELQRRMSMLLRHDPEDPEMAQKYLQAKTSWDVPTHERGSYSQRVLPMPAHEVSATVGALGNIIPKDPERLTWNAFHKIGKGGTLFTLGGDRSNLGRLTHINGKPLAWPVDLHAGTKYMAEPNPGAVWANAKGAASALRKNILEAAKYGPVYGAFAPMSPTSVDSSVNMFDTLMSQIPSAGISKKDAKAFDDSLRAGLHIKGTAKKDITTREKAKEIMQNWPGVLNAEKARDFAAMLSGAHRGAIVKHMEAAPWQNSGFPSVGITRAAITDPELISTAGNMMGHHVVELDPSSYERKNLLFEHSTYGFPTKGKLVGKLPFVERHVAMPDYAEKSVMDPAVVKKTGEPLIIHPYSPNPLGRASWRGNTELRQAVQPINERMLESIQQAHGSQFADGGDVGFSREIAPAISRQAKATRKPTEDPSSVLRALALSRSLMKGS